MKRFLKFLLNLILAVIVVMITLLVVFFLTPSWQKRVVTDALAQDTERKWQVGSVHIQPFRLEAEDVYVLDGPVGVGVKYIEAKGPFWKLAIKGKLEVDSGSILGLDMDLSRIRVGDLTSEDYQEFLSRVAHDHKLWEERIGLILSKAAVHGFRVHVENMPISGKLLMPGDNLVPVRWTIVNADSDAPRMIVVEPFNEPEKML